MKKIVALILSLISISSVMNAQDIQLPAPQTIGGMTLNEALMNRQTAREFAQKELTNQQLADLLWTANGVNRKDGKRTAPSARNCQEIDVYVVLKDAAYLYDANANKLIFKKKGDFRKDFVMQPFAATAPVLLIFVANYDKMNMDDDAKAFYGATDAGYVSQNVYLYSAANQMNTVVLGSIQREKIKEVLGFNGKAILGQPVGLRK